MEDYTSYETVRNKLITAGIKELQNHGVADFSLRRVAAMCNVSCAAPYKHFKSKEDFIAEILRYINVQWELIQNQVKEIFSSDKKRQLTEICVAYIKFRIANPGFNAVLMMKTDDFDENTLSGSHMTDYICRLITDIFESRGMTQSVIEQKKYVIRSLIYGAVIMIDKCQMSSDAENIAMIKQCIEDALSD